MAEQAFTVAVPTVADWGEVNDRLIELAEPLLAALGDGWDIEGPLYEGGESRVDLHRRQGDVELVVSLGIAASDEPVPPDPLTVRVSIDEQPAYVAPTSGLVANLLTGLVMGGGAATGFLVWRAVGSIFLGALVGIVTMIALLVATITIRAKLAGDAAPPAPPSAELLALVETVKRLLQR